MSRLDWLEARRRRPPGDLDDNDNKEEDDYDYSEEDTIRAPSLALSSTQLLQASTTRRRISSIARHNVTYDAPTDHPGPAQVPMPMPMSMSMSMLMPTRSSIPVSVASTPPMRAPIVSVGSAPQRRRRIHHHRALPRHSARSTFVQITPPSLRQHVTTTASLSRRTATARSSPPRPPSSSACVLPRGPASITAASSASSSPSSQTSSSSASRISISFLLNDTGTASSSDDAPRVPPCVVKYPEDMETDLEPEPLLQEQQQIQGNATIRSSATECQRDDPHQTIRCNPQKQPATTAANSPQRELCQQPDCSRHALDNGKCSRHGGGKRCRIDACECRAQYHGLCWKHGGYTMCTVRGCDKRAKSRGMCWGHGGGTKCKRDNCNTIAVSRGLCWAHGGGKRCLVQNCSRPGSSKYGDLCVEHSRQSQ